MMWKGATKLYALKWMIKIPWECEWEREPNDKQILICVTAVGLLPIIKCNFHTCSSQFYARTFFFTTCRYPKFLTNHRPTACHSKSFANNHTLTDYHVNFFFASLVSTFLVHIVQCKIFLSIEPNSKLNLWCARWNGLNEILWFINWNRKSWNSLELLLW